MSLSTAVASETAADTVFSSASLHSFSGACCQGRLCPGFSSLHKRSSSNSCRQTRFPAVSVSGNLIPVTIYMMRVYSPSARLRRQSASFVTTGGSPGEFYGDPARPWQLNRGVEPSDGNSRFRCTAVDLPSDTARPVDIPVFAPKSVLWISRIWERVAHAQAQIRSTAQARSLSYIGGTVVEQVEKPPAPRHMHTGLRCNLQDPSEAAHSQVENRCAWAARATLTDVVDNSEFLYVVYFLLGMKPHPSNPSSGLGRLRSNREEKGSCILFSLFQRDPGCDGPMNDAGSGRAQGIARFRISSGHLQIEKYIIVRRVTRLRDARGFVPPKQSAELLPGETALLFSFLAPDRAGMYQVSRSCTRALLLPWLSAVSGVGLGACIYRACSSI